MFVDICWALVTVIATPLTSTTILLAQPMDVKLCDQPVPLHEYKDIFINLKKWGKFEQSDIKRNRYMMHKISQTLLQLLSTSWSGSHVYTLMCALSSIFPSAVRFWWVSVDTCCIASVWHSWTIFWASRGLADHWRRISQGNTLCRDTRGDACCIYCALRLGKSMATGWG